MSLLAAMEKSDLLEVIHKSLRASTAPVTASTLSKSLTGPFKTKPKALAALLEEEVEAGRLCRHGSAKTPKYWDRGVEELAIKAALTKMTRAPITAKQLQAAFKGVGEHRARALVEALVESRRVFRVPPTGAAKSEKFSDKPPTLVPYFRAAVDKLNKEIRRLAQFGIGFDDAFETIVALLQSDRPEARDSKKPGVAPSVPATTDDDAALILRRVVELDPAARKGAAVSIPELRRSLDFHFADQAAFDRAVFELVRTRRAFVHRHDLPTSLEPAVREALVIDEVGNHYAGLSLPVDAPSDDME